MLLRLIEDGKPENFQLQIYDLPVYIANQIILFVSLFGGNWQFLIETEASFANGALAERREFEPFVLLANARNNHELCIL